MWHAYIPVWFEICLVRNLGEGGKYEQLFYSCYPLSQIAMSYRRFENIVTPSSLRSEAFALVIIDQAQKCHISDDLDIQVGG